MNIKPIINGAAHFLVKRITGPFWFKRVWLKQTERYSADKINALQLKLVRRLLRFCYRTIPFYKTKMDSCAFNPSISTLSELRQLPVLTKQEILDAGDLIKSNRIFRFPTSEGLTGGTTGTPLRIRRNIFSIGIEHAFLRRQWDWAGLGFGDRSAWLTGRQVVSPEQVDGKLYSYDPFMRELILSNYHLSRKSVPQFVEAIRKYHVTVLAGYTSAVHYFAQLVSDMGIKLTFKAVLTTSETINDEMRAGIESVFGCTVFDYYGSAERVCYAFTCKEGRYHLQEDYGYTELVPEPEHPEKNICRVISTGFWNKAMPLLRYDTGDLVELAEEPCGCGCKFRTVKRIVGRTGTFIQTTSGKRFSPTLMARVSKMTHNVLQTQIIQERVEGIIVTYVPNSSFSAKDREDLERNMRAFLPSELELEFRQVDSVIRTQSGKTNLIVSKVQ